MPAPNKKEPNQKLVFKKRYKEFDDFYDDNKPLIYKTIFDIFKLFSDKRKRTVTLHVSAKIKDVDWDTTFTFHRDDLVVLKRDIMPFFEAIEEFELCGEINNFCKDFTSK
jgi:hypothetical protein